MVVEFQYHHNSGRNSKGGNLQGKGRGLSLPCKRLVYMFEHFQTPKNRWAKETRDFETPNYQKSGADESGERDKSDERLRQMDAEAVPLTRPAKKPMGPVPNRYPWVGPTGNRYLLKNTCKGAGMDFEGMGTCVKGAGTRTGAPAFSLKGESQGLWLEPQRPCTRTREHRKAAGHFLRVGQSGSTNTLMGFVNPAVLIGALEDNRNSESDSDVTLFGGDKIATGRSGIARGKPPADGFWELSRAVLVTIDGAGHMAPYDKPEELLDMASRWLDGRKFT
ncbi:hypothetical protein CC1G_12157 [Coprinopsis cinerea okayama7|uniref:Uncharacterized protein n=1 Tax=Coprinopsis cinerea (strain Okayama-7 / 130 / ATCC MYA-4618 / FGSC 9003) TaxID=240176 RepID=A8N0B9_COPC7|nr:hypothetical protein CC1G_12157 [Coprinopsis cinerea okayama7\|eukprot:XP_001828316.2 hypothetical protein CC1G_12157 [Coprinopsis cinerea okayama7\